MFECIHRVPRDKSYIFKQLEERLIHFSHGRKVGKAEIVPESHSALHMREYLNYLQDAKSGPVQDLYGELCEITHPAHDSVWCMLPKAGDSTWRLDTCFDRSFIDSLCTRNRDAIDLLLQGGLAPSLMTLGLINHMSVEPLRTQAVNRIDLSIIGRYSEFRDKVSSAFILN